MESSKQVIKEAMSYQSKDKFELDELIDEISGFNKENFLEHSGLAYFDIRVGPVLTSVLSNTLLYTSQELISNVFSYSSTEDPLNVKLKNGKAIVSYFFEVKNDTSRGGTDMFTLFVELDSSKVDLEELHSKLRSATSFYKAVIEDLFTIYPKAFCGGLS